MAKKKSRSANRPETRKPGAPDGLPTPKLLKLTPCGQEVVKLRNALRDLLAYYDRLQDGRDHGGWSHADGARLAEIRRLAA